MATLTPTPLSPTGVTESSTMVSASSCGDKFKAVAKAFLRVTNGAASTRTITIANQVVGGSNISVLVDILANAPANDKMISFDDVGISNFTDDDGYVNISYSAVASVSVGLFQLP